MHGTDAFQVEGVVIEARPNRTWRVELANGHRLLAFVAGRAKRSFAGLAVGDKVRLQMTPYDLTTGRIMIGEAVNRTGGNGLTIQRFNEK